MIQAFIRPVKQDFFLLSVFLCAKPEIWDIINKYCKGDNFYGKS